MPGSNRFSKAAVRRKAAASAVSVEDFLWTAIDQEAPEPAEAPDPATVALQVMLERALRDTNVTLQEAARDGVATLLMLPSDDWAQMALGYWQKVARHGQRYGDRDSEGLTWGAWAPGPEPSKLAAKASNEKFVDMIARGRHCAGFGSGLSWLPPDLILSADVRIEVAPLNPESVAKIVGILCNAAPATSLTYEQAAALTPRMLRLARRIGQSADDYVSRLAEILERECAAAERTPPAGGLQRRSSPRDEPTLDRLSGMDEAVAWGLDLARDLETYRAGGLPWGAVDRGCLLSGPPGCGKTLFARALAATCGVPLMIGSFGQWHGAGAAIKATC